MANRSKKQKQSGAAIRRIDHDDTESVTAYMSSLDHPLKSVIEAIRLTILEADRTITEGIKWKSPSFYCHGWFATVNIREKKSVQVVLHHGAKVRDESTLSLTIDDSAQLLTWLSKDRAIITFASAEDFRSKQKTFRKLIKQWAAYQAHLATLT
jgi:hypothetical protein